MKKLVGCFFICFLSIYARAQWTTSGTNIYNSNTGGVAIGTTNPNGYLLAVNGSAIFTSAFVKPYASWPDFVFKPGYRLPSLDSLATYIRNYSHLPGIPSALVVAEKGIDLGANQAAMLKKIEELTLYIIDQNNTIRKQEARLERLENLLKP